MGILLSCEPCPREDEDENEDEALDQQYLPLRDCISESQGYQAFPPLIMSQPPVVYVLAEPETATWPPFTPALIVNHMYTRALPFTM